MKSSLQCCLATAAIMLCTVSSISIAQTAPPLGTTEDFAVLGASAVSNTGATVVNGDLGIWPSTASSITGFPPGRVTGTVHPGDAVAQQAQSDLTVAYNNAAGQACDVDLSGSDLGGLTLPPGVYCFTTSAQLTGTLSLDALGDPDAVFIFQISSTLTTATNARVEVINGGSGCNVFWQVGSSATLGTATAFEGNILALTSITLVTGASASGRLLARNGAVTLDTNAVGGCIVGACPIIDLAPTTLPQGTLGIAYSATVTASGGMAPYVYSISSGALPTGLLLNSATGEVSGIPTAPGNFSFTLRAVDANGCERSRPYIIVIAGAACPAILVAPASLPDATIGTPYSEIISASGGTAPYSFSLTAGALPPGLMLDPTTGELSGTLITVGNFSFTVTATDANFCVGSQPYTIVVNVGVCPTLSIAPLSLPPLIVGVPFSQTFVASGGTAPYTYNVTGGVLPPGLTLNPLLGELSGIPSTAGAFNFTITAIDALGCAVSAPYAVQVVLGGPALPVPATPSWSLMLLAIALVLIGMAALRRIAPRP